MAKAVRISFPDQPSALPQSIDPTHFSVIADRLSERLLELEERLNAFPAKQEIAISNAAERDLKLGLERRGDEWKLVARQYINSDEFVESYLNEASLEIKARVARLVPQLLEKLFEDLKRRTELVQSAHIALDHAAALFDRVEKEGV